MATLSHDGRYAAFLPYDSPASVSLITVESGQVSALGTDVSGVAGFSPDSTQILLGRTEPDAQGLLRTVWRAVPVAGGPDVATFRPPATATDQTWAPDGKGIVFRDRNDPAWNVFRQDAGRSELVQVTHLMQGRIMGYAWSPDGNRLALIHRVDEGSNVLVTARDGSRPVPVTQFTSADIFAVRWLPDSRRLAVAAGKLSRDVVMIRSFR